MNQLNERRKKQRIALTKIENVMRVCDIAVQTEKEDVDITIQDISISGMKITINENECLNELSPGDHVFIRGCIFNDSIGFLSSQKASIIWKHDNILGLLFTPELDITAEEIKEMLSTSAVWTLN